MAHTFTIPVPARHLSSYTNTENYVPVMTRLYGRAALHRRDMDGGAIAGTVVGVIVFVALLGLCLYPVVIRQVRKRRQQRDRGTQSVPTDVEAGFAADAAHIATPSGTDRRLSSTDSVKPVGPYSARNTLDHDAPFANLRTGSTTSQPQTGQNQTPFASYDGAYYPGGDPSEPRGANADYYSPTEVFGVLPGTTQKDFEEFLNSTKRSRGSSLRDSLKDVFRRGSGRTDSWTTNPVAPVPEGITNLQVISYTQGATESPGQMSPTEATYRSSIGHEDSSQNVKTPPLTQRGFHAAPSPAHPAPGTINPMDVMAPSTEAERFYRTDYELHHLSTSPTTDAPKESEEVVLEPSGQQYDSPSEEVNQMPTPAHVSHQAVVDAHPARQDTDQTIKAHEDVSVGPMPVPDMVPAGYDVKAASYPSYPNTPAIGHASMTPSSQMSPYSTTENDMTSPGSSAIHSDFRHSMSPASVGLGASPQTGQVLRFPCEEPGCGLAFDQMHKLNHHQRYHNKEHKCTYAGCDKGFGTKTHLERHINDRHLKTKTYHCAVPGCDYTRTGGKSFSRKDNWKRHMTKIHNMDRRALPEPEEVDVAMSGT